MKSLITTNPGSTDASKNDYSEKMENTDTFKQQKQNIKQEVLNQVQTSDEVDSDLLPNASANQKIVKPIKGGTSEEYFKDYY